MSNSVIHVSERTSLPLTSRNNQIRLLSERLIQAQRPLRILEAIQWQPDIEEQFLAKDGRELPRMTRQTYECTPLPFDRSAKLRELRDLERDICRLLGHANACSQMMVQRLFENIAMSSSFSPTGARQSLRPFHNDFSAALRGSCETIH